MNLFKIKYFCSPEDTVNKTKRQNSVFLKYTVDKGLIQKNIKDS